LVRHRPHKPEMRGFESRPRYEGWQRARAGTDGKALRSHSPMAQLAARPVVTRQVPGSSPGRGAHGAVAQLVRAPGRQPGGRRFKSGQSRHRQVLGRRFRVRVAQPAEHELDTLEVAGSKPAADTVPRTLCRGHNAPMAQRIAHLVTNQRAAGSSPARGTRRSVAQRQSSGSTHRDAQVRVLPDRLRTNRIG
jgi:hypothetical protein